MATARNLRVVNDHLDSPASGKARLRVVHAGTDAGKIDVRSGDASAALFDNLDYQSVTDYRDVAPINGQMQIVSAGQSAPVAIDHGAPRSRPLLHPRHRRQCRRPEQGRGIPDRRRAHAVRKRARTHRRHPDRRDRASAAIGIVVSFKTLEPRMHDWVTDESQQSARQRNRARAVHRRLDSAAAARA